MSENIIEKEQVKTEGDNIEREKDVTREKVYIKRERLVIKRGFEGRTEWSRVENRNWRT